MSNGKDERGERVVATNRKAYHEYHIDEVHEAGLVLTGTEIKSVRAGRISLREGYAKIEDGEAWLVGVHIAPYEQGAREGGRAGAPRGVSRRAGGEKGAGAPPGGKKQYDKREETPEREAAREIE